MEKLQFQIVSSDPDTPWHVCVKCNQSVIFDQTYFKESTVVTYEFDDTQEQEHCICIEISGKRDQDTVLDSTGAIVKDSILTINQFVVSDIDIDPVITAKAQYCHSFNGHGDLTQEKFFNTVGCNGTVEFKFSSPIYIWLLENM